MKYGITWSNDEESVCQTGYFTNDINEARDVAVAGLKLGAELSTWGYIRGHQVDGMNDPKNSQAIKYAVIQTGEEDGLDDIETIVLGNQFEAIIL